MVELRSTRCGLGACTSSLRVGPARATVRSQGRTMSPEEATGLPRESLLRRAASGVGGAIRRGLGGSTYSMEVGLGTRTARNADGVLELRCDAAWVRSETRSREDGEDVVEVERVADGVACTAATPADTLTPRWRFRAGISPERDSLRAMFETGIFGADGYDVGTVTLDRLVPPQAGAAPATVPYSVTMEQITITGLVAIPGTRWTFRRRDGTVIGAILRPQDPIGADVPFLGAALDLAPAAEPEEATVLRLVASVLAEPLRGTR